VLPYPPDSGPKVKTWNLLKYLTKNHEVTLVSFVRGDQSNEIRHLEKYCHAVYTVPIKRGPLRDLWYLGLSFLTGQPFLMVRDDRSAMRRLIDRLAAETQFDVVHADQLNMAQYAARVPGASKVLDAHNALWLLYKRLAETMSTGPKRWLLERDWRLLKQYEGQICREFDAVLAVSEEDKVALEEAAGQKLNLAVIPIAVDIDELSPVKRQAEANHILHIGTMYWPPNIDGIQWFIQQVYPLIRARRPDVLFDVVGARPPQELLDLNKNGSGVNVTGYVVDPAPYLEAAGVMVVPLRAGGGMRVKILNALAQQLPMVSTTIGCEGINVVSGCHLLIADTPEAFAEATLRLLENRNLANELGRNGRNLIESIYDYRKACRPIDEIYHKSIAGNAPASLHQVNGRES
jgi:glycosyltransferase involved in cell wall biosynthesis